jgi:hypothetical protein
MNTGGLEVLHPVTRIFIVHRDPVLMQIDTLSSANSISRHSPTSPRLSVSSTWNLPGRHLPRAKRPRPSPLVLWSIDEEATPSEYDVGGLDLGAESPRSTSSTTNLLENNAYVRQWAEGRAPRRNSLPRTTSFSKDRQRSQRDDDRDCGIWLVYYLGGLEDS